MVGDSMSDGCMNCLADIYSGDCGQFFEAVSNENGPCGAANHCGNYACAEQYPDIGTEICSCLVGCLQPAPPYCAQSWEGMFNCTLAQCGSVCP